MWRQEARPNPSSTRRLSRVQPGPSAGPSGLSATVASLLQPLRDVGGFAARRARHAELLAMLNAEINSEGEEL